MNITSILKGAIFLAGVALFGASVFAYVYSDCFNCDPVGSYRESISEWKSYSPKTIPDDPFANHCEQMISWMNDTLTTKEEAEMLIFLNKSIELNQGLNFIKYLWSVYPVKNNDKNALDWILHKRGEQQYEKRVSFVAMMKKFITSGDMMVSVGKRVPGLWDYLDHSEYPHSWTDAVLLDKNVTVNDLFKIYNMDHSDLDQGLAEDVRFYSYANLLPKEASDTLKFPPATNAFIRFLLKNSWYLSPTLKTYQKNAQRKQLEEARNIYGISYEEMLRKTD